MPRAGYVVARILVTLAVVAAGILVMNIPRIIRTGRIEPPGIGLLSVLADSGAVPPDSMPVDSARLIIALDSVQDPELGFSIVELGLIHRLAVDSAGNVSMVMALTMPECPFSRFLSEKAVEAIKAVPGVGRIELRVDAGIPWDPGRLSGEARARYDNVFGNDSGNGR